MKKILGLDLGTNSIGWALVEQDPDKKQGKIIKAGTRIIPMSQDVLGKFDSGQSVSQTAERTSYRGIRRLRERHLLRRERLHRVLNILGFLPEHYKSQIDFNKNTGQFFPETEPKLPYTRNLGTNKADFIFKESFEEMLQDFVKHQPSLLENNKKIPYDWTIYFLRKKALSKKIKKEELAWLLLHFNQKRGYYQLRGEEEEENPNKLVEFHSLLVTDVVDSGDKKGKDEVWYNVHLENGWIYRRTSKVPLDWTGKRKEFIVTTELNDDGTIKKDKEGKEKRSFRAPAEDDWTLLKKKTEFDIDKSNKTVGTYIYDTLLQNPNQKIKGKLVRVIERKFYKEELEAILKKQTEYHSELTDKKLYNACIEELYRNNEGHKQNIRQKDFVHLFLNDIIYYQRPLKSKKSLISNCKFESKTFERNGKNEIVPLKCIAKSHPLFQEFRLWQFLQNLRIYQKEKVVAGKLQTDVNVTQEFLNSEEDWTNLFDWLNERKEIDQKSFFKYPAFNLKKNVTNFRWNYAEDKFYPCNETRAQIKTRLKKITNVPSDFLTPSREENLWHILYSVEDKNDIQKALKTFAQKNELGNDFVEEFKKFPPFKKEYGSYSTKAINKLLPLMRTGKYWNAENIDSNTKERIEKITTGEYDKTIRNRAREKAINLNDINDFKNLPVWLASYIVYDRHSEDGELLKWKTPSDIEDYLRNEFKQHSFRNPIVEQVITETLRVVQDIWKQYGGCKKDFFNEIHIELGREMKNPAEKRKQMTDKIKENENTNLRIKALLIELLNDKNIENVRPHSPSQQEILKIYEEGILNADENIPEDILKISKQAQPTSSELTRYKLWLQQGYRSPYTGELIPLGKLFTPAYEIEHIIPQSRYFDDSFNNKVICESEVNKDKGNCMAFEYILKEGGKIIELGFGKKVKVLDKEAYEKNVQENYSRVRGKMQRLLMEDIPESFIQRQLNDSRYISKAVKGLLSNIVREENEQEFTSKNIIVTNGNITSVLKNDWGLNDIWNEIVTPRFERLNELTQSNNFGEWTTKNGKKVFQIQVPLELQRGFNKKRIDHRHHALDAIVIACASRSHINYLNNENALAEKKTREEKDKKRYDLRQKLCFKKYNDDNKQNYKWAFHKPWDTFTQETKETLTTIVVSFKQNLRIINKTVNYYQGWIKNEDNNLSKGWIKQIKGENWAIRKPLHKDTVSGIVQLKFKKFVSLSNALDNWEMITDKDLRKQIRDLIGQNYDKKKLINFFKDQNNKWKDKDISKVEIHYWDNENVASRVNVDETFNSSKITKITDTGIQRIMLNHLQKYNEEKNGKIIEHAEIAFSPDGVDEMNKNILELNNGKPHQPIFKVRTFEPRGNKFNVGIKGNKKHKFVEAAKGTNLYFAVYIEKDGNRKYDTIPLNIVLERLKQGLPVVPTINESGDNLLFHLSPNDLVYIPGVEGTEEPLGNLIYKDQINRIYKIVSFTGSRLYALPHSVAISIVDKVEYTQLNKLEFSLDKISIKGSCIKLKIDRLGNIGFIKNTRFEN